MSTDIRIVPRDQRDEVGEGPLWVASQRALYWVDIFGNRLNRLVLADGAITTWAMPERLGWVIERKDRPGFVAGFESGVSVLELDPLRITPLVSLEPDRPGFRLNDAKADADGAIWAGTMALHADAPEGGFHRIDPDGAATRVDNGYTIPNGPAISHDGRWLYHADSALGVVYRYAMAGGKLSARAPFITFEPDWGLPDGMTVDAEGGLWIAHFGGGCVSRFTADGRRERRIDLPATQITSCAFAGDNLDRLFVTSAALGKDGAVDGALFEVDPGVRGVLPCAFAG